MSMPSFSAVVMLLGLVPALEASEKQILKVYPVADLVVPISGLPGWNSNKVACPATVGCAAHSAIKHKATCEDTLMKLITNTVKPASWSEAGGIGSLEYFPLGMGLVVRQSEEAHKELSALLDSLRRLQDTEVAIEIRVVTKGEDNFERIGIDFNVELNGCPKGVVPTVAMSKPNPVLEHSIFGDKFAAPGAPKFLSEKELAKWLEEAQGDRRTNVMQAPKLTMFNGQQAMLHVGDTQNFVTSVLVKEVNGQMTAVPKTETHFIGTKFDVQGIVSADQRFVAVNLKAALSQLNGPVPLFPVAMPIFPVDDKTKKVDPVTFTQFIQQPNIQKIVAERSAMIPDGCTMLFAAGTMMTETRTENCPPVLSRIPYINRLFKTVGYGREAQTVYILVTPRVIVNGEADAKQLFGSGNTLISKAPLLAESATKKKIESMLEEKSVSFHFKETPFDEAIGYLETYLGISIDIDTKALSNENIDPKMPITSKVKDVTLRSALEELMMKANLTFVIKKEVIRITTAAEAIRDMAYKTKNGEVIVIANEKSAPCDKPCPECKDYKVTVGHGVRISVPPLGSTPLAVDVGCPACVKTKTSTASMNLADIVALSSSGVSDEIIINQIQTSSAAFTLVTEDILFLKKNKVSDKVVIEMQNSRGRNDPAVVPAAAQMMPMPFHPMTQYYPVPFTMPVPAYPPMPYPQYQPMPQPAYAPSLPCLPAPTICPVGGYGPPSVPPTPYTIPMPVSRNEAAGDFGQFLLEAATELVEITAELVGGIVELFVESGNVDLEFKIVPAAPAPNVTMPKIINYSEDSDTPLMNRVKGRLSPPPLNRAIGSTR